MDIGEVYEYLGRYGKSGKPVENLSRIKCLLKELGDPQEGLKFIHVAGTNGKGSVCEMLTEMLYLQDVKVGTFTSPFVLEYADRIRINKRNIPDHYLIRHTETVKNAAARTPYGNDYSQFEITMCIALLHFKECGCDVVVWETGVGGLNDCTNVIQKPLVSVICSVSYDHTAILGETLEEIAAQKAGIIKHGCPVVLSPCNDKAVEDVVRRTAICRSSSLTIPDMKNVGIFSDTLQGCDFTYKGKHYSTSMCGIHQVRNAVTAIEAVRACSESIRVSENNIAAGVSNAVIPARTQILSADPLLILDGGHNPDGFKALGELLSSKTPAPRCAVVGILKDKKAAQSIEQLLPLCDMFITVDSFHPNAVNASELAQNIEAMGGKACAADDTVSAMQMLKDMRDKYNTQVICGSLYLASDVLNKLAPEEEKQLLFST